MENKLSAHTFHIPVMGIGFTVDTPVKVAKYGISSVISLVDDKLIERMRKVYSEKLEIPFQAISSKIDDYRAKRITSYLNLIDEVVKEKFEELKKSVLEKSTEVEKYFSMLPSLSELKEKFEHFVENNTVKEDVLAWLDKNLPLGSIDVNIMTKLDREYFRDGEKLPVEYNDAHAALRGFAESSLNSSIVFSAGMNPRLYSYIENFRDFYPDEIGNLKKRIILKVSDYRSAIIQGKFLAKKGLWVSEFRIESGLNCGGHAFATNGFLLGPVLEEFKVNRDSLQKELYEIYTKALESKGYVSQAMPQTKVSVQGGVGTAEEHEFLLNYYQVDSVGWGTPFLLVPEVVNVDNDTLKLLSDATEKDLYTSRVSPLGVLFNNVRGNTMDMKKMRLIAEGNPGSVCPNGNAAVHKDAAGKPICSASRVYQRGAIEELKAKNLDFESYNKEYEAITMPACICNSLGTSAMLVNGIEPLKAQGTEVAVCPGPAMAYFSEPSTLQRMVSHIYGRENIIKHPNRPNMFVKELRLYVDYLKQQFKEASYPFDKKQTAYFEEYQANIKDGIEYYKGLVAEFKGKLEGIKSKFLADVAALEKELKTIKVHKAELVPA